MGFASAMHKYMTPRYRKPSAHEVMTAVEHQFSSEEYLRYNHNFNTTIALMEDRYFKCSDDSQELNFFRNQIYDYVLDELGLEYEIYTDE